MSALKPRLPMSLCPMTSRFRIAPLFCTCPAFVPSPVPPPPFFSMKLVSGSSARSSGLGVARLRTDVPRSITRMLGITSSNRCIISPFMRGRRRYERVSAHSRQGDRDVEARSAGTEASRHVDSQTKFIRVAGQRCGRYAASRRNELPPMRRQGATAEVADPLRDRWLVRPPKGGGLSRRGRPRREALPCDLVLHRGSGKHVAHPASFS